MDGVRWEVAVGGESRVPECGGWREPHARRFRWVVARAARAEVAAGGWCQAVLVAVAGGGWGRAVLVAAAGIATRLKIVAAGRRKALSFGILRISRPLTESRG